MDWVRFARVRSILILNETGRRLDSLDLLFKGFHLFEQRAAVPDLREHIVAAAGIVVLPSGWAGTQGAVSCKSQRLTFITPAPVILNCHDLYSLFVNTNVLIGADSPCSDSPCPPG